MADTKKIRTVNDLISELQKYDGNTEVFVYNGEFMIGNIIGANDISFCKVHDERRHNNCVSVVEPWDEEDRLIGKNVRNGLMIGYEKW
jgi:hypothetical protein